LHQFLPHKAKQYIHPEQNKVFIKLLISDFASSMSNYSAPETVKFRYFFTVTQLPVDNLSP